VNRHLRTTLTILVLIAMAAGGNFLYQRQDRDPDELSRASVDWLSVPGLVTRSELVFRRSETDANRKTDVDVTYEYVVGDKVYRNDIVRFDQGELPGSRKELLVSSYPAGRRVEVFYNPDDPDQSVLMRGSRTPD
jgi:hypothetical protein